MKIETRQTMAATAADRWERQYGGDMEGKAAKIRALGDSPSPADVEAVIGNDSWTHCMCDECGKKVETVVVFGQDWKEFPASVCGQCFSLAMLLFAVAEEQLKHLESRESESGAT